ncbi:YiiD C-terminal domain-containing protein [Devosia sp. XK-2]|uniref:YiiD C-terminal domain-containing protein n=1 Tax=Devosia sp. XK-2 TaxID=3126689 RepID=UPI0030CFE023
MTPAALTDYLHRHMPLSRAMAVTTIESSAEMVVLEAPLAPNINVHGTMFGGSVATLGLLAAWSVLHLGMEAAGLTGQLVIHRTSTDYLRPIEGIARAVAKPNNVDWGKLGLVLARRGKARLSATADIAVEDAVAARLDGIFVAIAERSGH